MSKGEVYVQGSDRVFTVSKLVTVSAPHCGLAVVLDVAARKSIQLTSVVVESCGLREPDEITPVKHVWVYSGVTAAGKSWDAEYRAVIV